MQILHSKGISCLLFFCCAIFVLWLLTTRPLSLHTHTHTHAHAHIYIHYYTISSAHDIPEKSKCIEIYNCFNYMKMRLHWNGCGLLLHEYCHLIHQCCLPSPSSASLSPTTSLQLATGLTDHDSIDNGLYNATVIDAYETAKRSKLYDNVLRRDWAGKKEDYDMGK